MAQRHYNKIFTKFECIQPGQIYKWLAGISYCWRVEIGEIESEHLYYLKTGDEFMVLETLILNKYNDIVYNNDECKGFRIIFIGSDIRGFIIFDGAAAKIPMKLSI